ncbi:dienelactone hydrolase family protein [Actinacidiphila epipremni]|uniref:Alpha/beta hydrolase n=1 Tax=Actinacidiphila epipremni TaxID=2053013 RepID=A0ABX0ZZJ2_9ACTN|nr:alpha/beta hydrolase [Actinacidiphila epipremni]NJP48302.1 alpha/beta hydrolase [Actinacidiphila epipremni]
MRFTSERRLDDGVVEREFTLGEIPGILWTPEPASAPARVTASAPATEASPLILLGIPPLGLRRMHPRLLARARHSAAEGFATATIELPGSGDRPRWPALDQARAELRRVMAAGEPVSDTLVDDLVLPLVDKAAPEWQETLDALLALPAIGGPVGYSGGLISLAIRLAAVEPRITAAVLFAGSLVPRSLVEQARGITIPLHVLLQWDDEGNDRQAALDLFDAFGSPDKSLHAHLGGHTGVPRSAGDAAARFFTRHLR